VIKEKAWYNGGMGKQKYSEENLSQCNFACRKSHVDSAWTEPRCPESDKYLSYGIAESSLKIDLQLSIMSDDGETAHLSKMNGCSPSV